MVVLGVDPRAAAVADELIARLGVAEAQKLVVRQAGYVEPPPSLDTFCDDPFYLGDMVGSSLYPIWRAGLNEVFPTPYYSPYEEVITTGAIGTGKTTASMVGLLYDICRLLHLDDPIAHYGTVKGLLKSTVLAFAVINATLNLADSVIYEQLQDWLHSSPFFREQLDQAEGGDTILPKNVHVIVGSRFSHVLGQAIIGAILSELNFQTKLAHQAYDNYTNVKRRLQTRFPSPWARPGRLWLDSSKAGELSFLEAHIKKSMFSPSVKVFDFPLWAVQNSYYSGETFAVFLGTSTQDPMIVDDPEQISALPPEAILWVPVEHRQAFEDDLLSAINDLGGQAIRLGTRLILSTEKLYEALCLPPATTSEVIVTRFGDPTPWIQYLTPEALQSLRSAPHPWSVHVDLGIKKDRTGIGLTRFDQWLRRSIRDPVDFRRTIAVDEPCFVTGAVFAAQAKAGSEVPIGKVKELICDLRSAGVQIQLVSTDGWQSVSLRQDLAMANFETDLVSVDKTPAPYQALAQAIMIGAWKGPQHSILQTELENLLVLDSKIDHPMKNPDGSPGGKDVADGTAGSLWTARQKTTDQAASRGAMAALDGMTKPKSRTEQTYQTIAKHGARWRPRSHGSSVHGGIVG